MNPGYSAIGRLRGLAELRGLELGISGSYAYPGGAPSIEGTLRPDTPKELSAVIAYPERATR